MRYSNTELQRFFRLQRETYKNVEIMLQEEGDMYGCTFGLPVPKS